MPLSVAYGVSLVNGKPLDWKKLDKQLKSHSIKLKVLLAIDLLGTGIDPTAKSVQIHLKSVSRVELFNTLKNSSLYAGVYQGELFKPSGIFDERVAKDALTVSQNRFQTFLR